ncbi:hypothetical protein [Sinomonas mesophila]|uniref:hypothetical protein n=1 Tax=Sinomonas mesophila TaxID=1531955 RepID=UPI001C37AE85|nr:hypothetical protein [Sinomonas mesophila]
MVERSRQIRHGENVQAQAQARSYNELASQSSRPVPPEAQSDSKYSADQNTLSIKIQG